MVACIEATDGTVGDFIGGKIVITQLTTADPLSDGILVFWNSPEPVPMHASRACECAMAMHAKLEELNKQWSACGFPEIMCRIGIHSGNVLSGNIGSPDKMKFGKYTRGYTITCQ